MKKKLPVAICILALISVLSVALVACNPDDGKPKDAVSYVSIDINPAIELTLDEDNKVVSVYGANEDGQVLLYGEDGIVGVNVESAVEKITSLAVEFGYIGEDNKVIQTSVTAKNSDELLSKINTKISATAAGLNINVSMSGADAYSLLRKLEQVKAQYPDNEAIQALTPEQFKVVISASEAGNITIEAAAELNTEQLVKIISNAHAQAKEFATAAYDKATVLAQDAYDKAVGVAMDGIYTTYYMSHHKTNAYYGFAYQGYKSSARGLNAIANALAFVEDLSVQPIDSTRANDIATLLGVDVNELEDANGDVTVKSIEAYADKMFKNSPASEELEQLKADLTEKLNSVESAIKTKVNELAQEYAPQIEIISTSLNTVIDGIKGLEALIPAPLMTQLQTIKADMTELATDMAQIVSDLKISSQEIRELADKMTEKSNAALAQIESDLTQEELDEIAALQQEAMDGIANAKTQLDNALAQAEQSAKQWLEQQKNSRQNG